MDASVALTGLLFTQQMHRDEHHGNAKLAQKVSTENVFSILTKCNCNHWDLWIEGGSLRSFGRFLLVFVFLIYIFFLLLLHVNTIEESIEMWISTLIYE